MSNLKLTLEEVKNVHMHWLATHIPAGESSEGQFSRMLREANDAKPEPVRTTMSFEEYVDGFPKQPFPKDIWNAALEHSVELIEAKKRIEELEGFVADAANDAEGWTVSIEQLCVKLANSLEQHKTKLLPTKGQLKTKIQIWCQSKQRSGYQTGELVNFVADLIGEIFSDVSPQLQNHPSILDLEKGQSAIDHLKSALELLEGKKK